MRPYVDAGKLVVIGVVQEQHPDRARLYRQWRQLEWPIAFDSYNRFDFEVVPIPTLIDEAGNVVAKGRVSPEKFEEFMKRPVATRSTPLERSEAPDPEQLEKNRPEWPGTMASTSVAKAWFEYANDLAWLSDVATDPEKAHDYRDRAIEAYYRSLGKQPDNPRARFRMGVALRKRHESADAEYGDAQRAVDMWQAALADRPSQYIWRRRLQQFGPRLTKPYNFYGWVAEARAAIIERGEKPVPLVREPRGSELLGKSGSPNAPNHELDLSTIPRDFQNLIEAETIITPKRIRPGDRARVRVLLRPNPKHMPYWNNEGEPVILTRLARGAHSDVVEFPAPHPQPSEAETQETRILELEIAISDDAKSGDDMIRTTAVYTICEKASGVCRRLRCVVNIQFTIDPSAQSID